MSVKTHPIPEDRFMDYVAELNRIRDGVDLPHAACCAFLLGSGARIGEALTVRIRDVFAPDGTPKERVTRNVEKARADRRITVTFPWQYLGGPIVAWHGWITRHRAAGPEDFLFSLRWSGGPISRFSLHRGNRRLLDRLGIPWRGVGLHGLRKTILRRILADQIREGRSWIEAMRYCQQFVGHDRLDTTIRYLVDDMPTDNPDMMRRIFGAQYQQTAQSTDEG